jgi:hypothetical protein
VIDSFHKRRSPTREGRGPLVAVVFNIGNLDIVVVIIIIATGVIASSVIIIIATGVIASSVIIISGIITTSSGSVAACLTSSRKQLGHACDKWVYFGKDQLEK